MEKKLTKKEMFEKLLEIEEVYNDEDLVNFINHEIKLLNKKARPCVDYADLWTEMKERMGV